MNGLPQMATIKETAECLRCSVSLIEKMLDEGLLRSVKRPSPYNPLATRSLRVLIFVDSVHKLLGMSPKRQPSNASLEAEARAAGERMGWGMWSLETAYFDDHPASSGETSLAAAAMALGSRTCA